MNAITKPTLIVNESIVKANIHRMKEKADLNSIIFRPHFKTHQSQYIGQFFQELNINKITVSSVDMAKYFYQSGFRDITIAFPVNILEIHDLNWLADHCLLNLVVESEVSAKFLNDNIQSPINIYIKIDIGYHRTGIDPHNRVQINSILDVITQSNYLSFHGFLGHAGHSYDARTLDEINQIHQESIEKLVLLKADYSQDFPNVILSTGDTPTCSLMDDFSMVDEIRPGNFVFYDLTQEAIGSCKSTDIAIALACPIVAIHENRNEIIIYGGGTHFSKDRITHNGQDIFGFVMQDPNSKWGIYQPHLCVKKLSQEHGTISVDSTFIRNKKIGDILYILPVHSCMMAQSMRAYINQNGQIIDHL